MKWVLLLLMGLASCSQGMTFHPYTNETFVASRPLDEVLVFFENPKGNFRTIGFIDYDYYRPGWSAPTITEATPSIKKKVHELGGDAIIIRSQFIGFGLSYNLRIAGDVIIFQK